MQIICRLLWTTNHCGEVRPDARQISLMCNDFKGSASSLFTDRKLQGSKPRPQKRGTKALVLYLGARAVVDVGVFFLGYRHQVLVVQCLHISDGFSKLDLLGSTTGQWIITEKKREKIFIPILTRQQAQRYVHSWGRGRTRMDFFFLLGKRKAISRA